MSGYSTETRETAFQRWKARVPLRQISAELRVAPRSLESWRSVDGWIAREAREDAERVDRIRRTTERHLVGELPKLIERMLTLSESAESERIQFDATRYLIGRLGYSPDTSTERVRALATVLAEADALEDGASRDPASIAAELNALILPAVTSNPPPPFPEHPAGEDITRGEH